MSKRATGRPETRWEDDVSGDIEHKHNAIGRK